MRVGVAGFNASGKTEVVRVLEGRSFYPVSLSDVIREDLAQDGLEPTRENMIECGRELRERFGSAILAERGLRAHILGVPDTQFFQRAGAVRKSIEFHTEEVSVGEP